MKKLLIDIGNTTIHLKVWDETKKQFTHEQFFMTKQVLKNPQTLAVHFAYDVVFYASVVVQLNPIIQKTFPNAQSIMTFKTIKSTDFVYPTNLLGQDFIANFYGFNKADAVIISMGTATTFAIIQKHKMIGAIIAPGLESSMHGLRQNAPSLVYDLHTHGQWEAHLKGLNTVGAINKGLINGHWHMIQGMLAEIKSQYNVKDVVLTGGYAQFLQQDTIPIDLDLIFKGINTITQK